MITKFDPKIFFIERIVKWVYAIFIYLFSFWFSHIFVLNRFEFVKDLHFREFLIHIGMIKTAILMIDLSVTYYMINFVGLISNSLFLSYKEVENAIESTIFNSKIVLNVETRLDEANSFLYSNKTAALLE